MFIFSSEKNSKIFSKYNTGITDIAHAIIQEINILELRLLLSIYEKIYAHHNIGKKAIIIDISIFIISILFLVSKNFVASKFYTMRIPLIKC